MMTLGIFSWHRDWARVMILLLAMALKLESLRPIQRHDTRKVRQVIITDFMHAVLHTVAAWAAAPIGRYVALLNNPQWHRTHHSAEPKHSNFAPMFPFMDVLFATAYCPTKNEFPETGLIAGERPSALVGLLWPIRPRVGARV
jgi:hypothetical protein